MKFYDIMKKKTYTVQGQEKSTWLPVGKLKQTDDGKMFIELNHLEESFYVFEQKPREIKQDVPVIQVDEPVITNIPF